MDGEVRVRVPFHTLMEAIGDAIENMLERSDAGRIFSFRQADQLEMWSRLIRNAITEEMHGGDKG